MSVLGRHAGSAGPAVLALLLLWCVCLGVPARAHVVEQLYAEFSVSPQRDQWQAVIYFDAGFALPEMRADQDAPPPRVAWLQALPPAGHARIRAGAEEYLSGAVEVRWGDQPLDQDIVFPDFACDPPDFPASRIDIATIRVHLSGRLPSGPGELLWAVSDSGAPTFVLEIAPEEFISVAPGASEVCWRRQGGLNGGHAARGRGLFHTGFAHVLPGGIDHVLFILALFLYRRDLRSLLAQSLAFTVAHSMTLGLVLGGVVLAPTWPVEILIAASIAFVAIENLLSAHPHGPVPIERKPIAMPWRRLSVVFVFGLLHGMGFAAVLLDRLAGTGWRGILLANLGIEAAQLLILVTAWLLTLRWWRNKAYAAVRVGLSVVIAATGLWWALERFVG
jgi:hypothetical protein